MTAGLLRGRAGGGGRPVLRRAERSLRAWGSGVRRFSVRHARRARRRWRRSLRLRVVVSTMLLGLIVVVGVGNFLLARIRDGLVESREASAMIEAEQLTKDARGRLAAAQYTDRQGAEQFINALLPQLEGSADSGGHGVVLRRALRSTVPELANGRVAGVVSAAAIPDSLRQAVNDSNRQQVQLTSLPVAGDPTGAPAIAVGSIIDLPQAGPYELYFVFRLDREEQILNLVRRTFLAGGVALVLLVGAVAYVVTRLVVAPVRQAARTAEELASGRLDRRMKVRGEDDVARLGRAFNEMAAGLERQIHQLEDLSRVQRRFVSDVSHELRTPLTTIRMASELIYEARQELDPPLSRSAELLQDQLDRFESLLADLLEISRFDAGAAALDIEPFDLREVVARVVDTLAPLAERHGSRVRVHVPDVPCVAEIDSRRVERIVRNLLGNAIEHAESGPVDIRVAGSPEAVAVAVTDRGVGIMPEELPFVFNRFWRSDPARARSTGGTGLGLAIAQEDAHLHGGWLQAWGEPGVGASFRLTLPRRAGIVIHSSPLPLAPGDRGPLTGGFPLPGPTDVPASTGPLPPARRVLGP